MSSPFGNLFGFTLLNALHVAFVLVLALVCNRLLRRATGRLVQPATGSPARAAQAREQQTRALADGIYGAGSAIVWVIAALTALPEFGISPLPGATVLSAAVLGLSLSARNVVRDVVGGLQIAFEDQYAAGDTIQAGEISGRVEQVTLRRTVVRDGRGAVVSMANGELRTVSNLSRDWSQGFVDITVNAETPLEKALQGVEAAAAELRGDASWSQALVDGPRVLGVQAYEHFAPTLRLQVRTVPTRQEEVCRELRRRIQMEFERQGIARAGGR
jgi:small-conductance mechanosensitive channel